MLKENKWYRKFMAHAQKLHSISENTNWIFCSQWQGARRVRKLSKIFFKLWVLCVNLKNLKILMRGNSRDWALSNIKRGKNTKITEFPLISHIVLINLSYTHVITPCAPWCACSPPVRNAGMVVEHLKVFYKKTKQTRIWIRPIYYGYCC